MGLMSFTFPIFDFLSPLPVRKENVLIERLFFVMLSQMDVNILGDKLISAPRIVYSSISLDVSPIERTSTPNHGTRAAWAIHRSGARIVGNSSISVTADSRGSGWTRWVPYDPITCVREALSL
jgi:hypothetical protein